MNHAVIAAMAEVGETAESLAAQIGVDPKTAAKWASRGRIPQTRHRAKVAAILKREVEDLWPDAVRRREPAWFRPWADIEREAVSLRAFQLAWVPGLLQTAAYARATLAGEALSPEAVEELIDVRIKRQAILRRDRAPMFIAVLDELILRRSAYGDRALMREQCEQLAASAELPNVSIHVVPLTVGMHPGLGGPFTLAELEKGTTVAHVDSQAKAQLVDGVTDIATLSRRWERIRGGGSLPGAVPRPAQGSGKIMDLIGAQWRKSSKSGNNGGDCVEVAGNLPGVVGVRDSKDPTGPALVFGPAAWRAFVAQLPAQP